MRAGEAGPGITGWIKSKLKGAAVEGAVKRLGVPRSAARNLESFAMLSGSAASSLPTELLALAADMWSGFVYTPFAEQQMDGWVMPYWLRRQRTPSSTSFVPHGHFWLECNMTHRNWTGIGLCGYPNEATVDERGLVTPWPFAPSIDVWVKVGDTLVCPSEIEKVDQQLVEGFPIVRTTYDALGIQVALTSFVAPVDTVPFVLSLCESTCPGGGASAASLVISLRPCNPETLCAINDLTYDRSTRSFEADGNLMVYLGAEPDRVLISDYEHGDVAMQLRDPRRRRVHDLATAPRPGGSTVGCHAGRISVSEPFGLATGAAVFDLDLSGGSTSRVCFAAPLQAGVRPPLDRMIPAAESVALTERKLAEQSNLWADLVSSGMRISVPDDVYQRAFDVNKAFLMLLFDGRSITPGVATYHMMWFRDAAYLVPALDRIGRSDMAHDILGTYPDRQTPDGYFKSHSGEWDSNGQAMYTLAHHYRITADESFAKGVYPALMKGARWIDMNRVTDLPEGDPRRGLLPPGISAEHFGMGDVYYWDDFWALGGLEAARGIAMDLGLEGDAAYLQQVAAEMWKALESSWASVEERLGRRVMPIAPGRDVDSGSIGVLAAVYPLGLIRADTEIMANTIREIIEGHFYRDTYYHGILHCGLNAYLSLHVAQCLLQNRDPYALTVFESLMDMASATLTFPEAINPLTGGGAYGDGHHGWAVCEFLNFLRNVMLMEEGDVLTFLPLSRKEWFAGGNAIRVENAPTFFGEVSYSVERKGDAVTFNLPGRFDRPPRLLRLELPFSISSAEADGAAVAVAAGGSSIEVSATTKRVRAVID